MIRFPYRLAQFVIFGVLLTMTGAWTAPAGAQDMLWDSSTRNSPASKAKVIYFNYAVPQTDNGQVYGECQLGAGGTSIFVSFGAQVGKLADDTEVSVRFTGEDVDLKMTGYVVGTKAEAGITGFDVFVTADDPLWDALKRLGRIRYSLNGGRPAHLNLDGSAQAIKWFLRQCAALDPEGPAPKKARRLDDDPAEDPAGKPDDKGADDAGIDDKSADETDTSRSESPSAGARASAKASPVLKPVKPAEPAKPAEPVKRPAEHPRWASCETLGGRASQVSEDAVKVTFVNRTEGLRVLKWMGMNGRPVNYTDLEPGGRTVINTYLKHVWMITDGPGNCLEMVLPKNGMSIFEITAPNRPASDE